MRWRLTRRKGSRVAWIVMMKRRKNCRLSFTTCSTGFWTTTTSKALRYLTAISSISHSTCSLHHIIPKCSCVPNQFCTIFCGLGPFWALLNTFFCYWSFSIVNDLFELTSPILNPFWLFWRALFNFFQVSTLLIKFKAIWLRLDSRSWLWPPSSSPSHSQLIELKDTTFYSHCSTRATEATGDAILWALKYSRTQSYTDWHDGYPGNPRKSFECAFFTLLRQALQDPTARSSSLALCQLHFRVRLIISFP